MASDFSIAILDAKRPEDKSYRILRENYVQTRAIYLAKLAIKYRRKIKAFSDLQGLQEK